jgi:hypothetical protein
MADTDPGHLLALRTPEEDAAWLNCWWTQETQRSLDRAFQAFSCRLRTGERPGCPRCLWGGDQASGSGKAGWGEGGRLDRRGVGQLRPFLHRPAADGADIQVGLLQGEERGGGRVTRQVELPDAQLVIRDEPGAGTGVGVTNVAVLSTGDPIENPHRSGRAEREVGKLQGRRARRRPGRRLLSLSLALAGRAKGTRSNRGGTAGQVRATIYGYREAPEGG